MTDILHVKFLRSFWKTFTSLKSLSEGNRDPDKTDSEKMFFFFFSKRKLFYFANLKYSIWSENYIWKGQTHPLALGSYDIKGVQNWFQIRAKFDNILEYFERLVKVRLNNGENAAFSR